MDDFKPRVEIAWDIIRENRQFYAAADYNLTLESFNDSNIVVKLDMVIGKEKKSGTAICNFSYPGDQTRSNINSRLFQINQEFAEEYYKQRKSYSDYETKIAIMSRIVMGRYGDK